jgi:preprotein translocase subunit SecD
MQVNEGRAVISGSFTPTQADSLKIQLNAGTFPAPITIVDKHYIKHRNYK